MNKSSERIITHAAEASTSFTNIWYTYFRRTSVATKDYWQRDHLGPWGGKKQLYPNQTWLREDNLLVSLQWREDLPCSQHRTHRHRWMKFLTHVPYCQSDECQRFNDVVSGTGGFLLLHIRLCCRDVRIVVEPLFHLISCSRMIWTHQWKGSLLQALQARQRFPSGCKALSTLMWSPT